MMETIRRPEARRISCTDTAKLIRTALKRAFPGTTFSVKSHKYSGGASIHVSWIDGPLNESVEAVAKQYSRADFDGMIDLKCYSEHWLRPDGTVILAKAQGTQGSGGVIPGYVGPNRPLTDDAELVSFGADYVFCSRHLSPEFRRQIERKVEIHSGVQYDSHTQYNFYYDGEMFCNDDGATVVQLIANHISKDVD